MRRTAATTGALALLLLNGSPAAAATLQFHLEGTVTATDDPGIMQLGDTLALDYFIDEDHPNQEDPSDADERAFYSADDGAILADVSVNGELLLSGLSGFPTSEGSTNFLRIVRDDAFGDDTVEWKATDSSNADGVTADFELSSGTLPAFPDLQAIRGLSPPSNSFINVDLDGIGSFSADPVTAYTTVLVPEPSAALLTAAGLGGLAALRRRG